jgi:hypothetical protein
LNPLACWFCGRPLEVRAVLRDGILRARSEEKGGPFRLYLCPACARANHCEKTRRGRWFSSPSFEPNLLDYLLGRLFVNTAEDFLKAASWFRDNDERRRYFFERDGDRRYSGRSLALFGLWRRPAAAADERRAREAEPEPGPRRRPAAGGRKTAGGSGAGRETPRRPPRPGRLLAPWEVLGVAPDAGEEEIRRAFYRLAVLHHPDKVHHLGEESQRNAHEKFTRLQEAYETLLERRQRRS